jgi:hypothetical protein
MEAGALATVQDLICVLREIEASPEIAETEVLNRGNLEDKHNLIQQATLLAQEVLLVSLEDGGRNYEAEYQLLNTGGYTILDVADDESDWLMGAIETAKGLLAYA